jgi:thiamine pyrophosphokinase
MVSKRAVIFVNGEMKDADAVSRMLRPDDVLMAADGGLRHLEMLGLQPHYVVGDLDSLSISQVDRLEKAGVSISRFPTGKDETDLELALDLMLEKEYQTIVIAAALGGRTDHMLGNLFLLTRENLSSCDVRLDDGIEEVFLIRDRAQIRGCVGDLVSLVPLGQPVQGVVTHGLAYPLRGETLRPDQTRGISNVMTEAAAAVSVESGQLLCIHVRHDAHNCPSEEE